MGPLQIVELVRDWYNSNQYIPLHAPLFSGNEKKYVTDTIDSTFVSSVGAYVSQFEQSVAQLTGAADAVATVNGTSALQLGLYLAGVESNDIVITQSLTFIATCNAIHWLGAEPVFVDVEQSTLGLSPVSLADYLTHYCFIDTAGQCIERSSGKRVKAVVPMHTFGHPARLIEISQICDEWNLELVEDAAESLGSTLNGRHTGAFGRFGALSFNGNKIITTGGGGMLLCRNPEDGRRARHLSTTAKKAHPFLFVHDDYGFNFRMPNLNAALGCAQLELLPEFLKSKRGLAHYYQQAFFKSELAFFAEPADAVSNYWLNAIICPDNATASDILTVTNAHNVNTRPAWRPMHLQSLYKHGLRHSLPVTESLAERMVNLPSSVRSLPYDNT